ncbi:hypothetical protein ACEQPO_26630 [Bacillus sp. SL00103]
MFLSIKRLVDYYAKLRGTVNVKNHQDYVTRSRLFGMTVHTGKEAQANTSYVDQSIYTMNTSKVFTTESEVKKAGKH